MACATPWSIKEPVMMSLNVESEIKVHTSNENLGPIDLDLSQDDARRYLEPEYSGGIF